jgi:O-succinylbenzoate synthase
MGVALAAALPDLPFDCGLGTASLFTGDVAAPPLVPHGGELPTGPVVPDAAALDALAAPAERRAWWLERLARCHALLERSGRNG